MKFPKTAKRFEFGTKIIGFTRCYRYVVSEKSCQLYNLVNVSSKKSKVARCIHRCRREYLSQIRVDSKNLVEGEA